jgi:dienelactone hydrolase
MTRTLVFVLLTLTVSSSVRAQGLKPDLIQLFDYDKSVALDVKQAQVEEANGVKVFDVSYASPKEGRVTAFLVVPPGTGPFPALLFGHWGPGNRTEFLPEAKLYAEAGTVSLMIDYPWTRPAPWRRSTEGPDQPERDKELYIQAVVDLRRGIDLLLSLPNVDPARIGYVGHSYGAQWGAILSAVEKRIRASVLMGGVPDVAAIWIDNDDPDVIEWRKKQGIEKIKKYAGIHSVLDAIQYVRYAAPTPLLFQFAMREQYFNEAAMKRYAEAASEPKTVKWYLTGHDLNDFQALIDRARWLQKNAGIGSITAALQKKLAKP